MSKDYGVTKRFEDLENRPQGGGKLPENYLYNTSFEVVSGNTINPRLEWWKGEYGYNTSEPYGGRRSVEIESNDGYIETSMERVWLSSVGADIESRYTGETSTEPLEGSKWGYQETILSFYYKGQGVNVVVSTDDTQVARESAPYAESWTRFHMRIPALESHNEFKIRVDNSGLFSGITTALDCFQLERVTESGEPSTYVPGKYSTTDLGLATKELERTAERITGLERETWKPKFNMIYNSSFLKRDMYGDANFWTIYYPYRNRTYPAYTDTGFDLETYRSSISEYDHIVSEMPHFMFLRVFCQLKPTVEEGKGGFYLPESPDRAYYHFSFYAVARLGEATDQVDPTLRVHLISLDNPDKEPIVLGDVVVSRSRDTGEWNKETANPSIRHLKAVSDKNSHYWNKYDLVFQIEDNTLSTTERMGIMLSDETEEYGAVWLLSKLMLQVLDGGDFSYLGHDYIEGGGNIIEPAVLEDSRIGNLSELNTTNKDTLVDAVNEVLSGQGGIQEEIDPKVGDLSGLATNNKSDVVSALNEVFSDVDEGKRSIASALTDKQQPSTGDETFSELSNRIRAIQTGGGVVNSNQNLLTEQSQPTYNIYGTANAYIDDTYDSPLILFTDDMESYEVNALYRDLEWEFSIARFRLGDNRKRRKVHLMPMSLLTSTGRELITNLVGKFKPVLALTGVKTSTASNEANSVGYLGVKVPVFDMSYAPETGCARNLLLGTGTAVSLPKTGQTVSDVTIGATSQMFANLRGSVIKLPIYPTGEPASYFPMMLSSDFTETIISRTVPQQNLLHVTLANGSGTAWYSSKYVDKLFVEWLESTNASDPYITNKDIGDSQSANTSIKFTGASGTKLSFEYKVDSELNYDFFALWVNETQIFRKSGSIDWTYYEYTLPSTGSYEVRFNYYKDSSVSNGLDSAFVRNVKFSEYLGENSGVGEAENFALAYTKQINSTVLGVYTGYCMTNAGDISKMKNPMGGYNFDINPQANSFLWSMLLWGDEV